MTKIEKFRTAKGLTRTELAYLSGVSYASIAAYETLRREPALSVGIRMADALGVKPKDLIEESWKDKKNGKAKPVSDISDNPGTVSA